MRHKLYYAPEKKEKSDYEWISHIALLLVLSACFFTLGYTIGEKPRQPVEVSNYYNAGMRYIVFETGSGVTVVNYTLDSLKKKFAE